MDISDSMLRRPSKSLRKLVKEKYIGLATAPKAVQEKMNLFPYKVIAVQELKPACGHHIQHLLQVYSDLPNTLYMVVG
jgi:hypothetical protein